MQTIQHIRCHRFHGTGATGVARRVAAALACCTVLLAATPTSAREPTGAVKPLTVSGNATFVSDYRFRGVSLSNKNPAVQAGINLNHQSGVFGSIWGSSIDNFNGATTEIDLTGGWSGSLGDFTPTVGMIAFLYPGGTRTNYFEIYASLGATLGPASLTMGLNFSPEQENVLRSDRYVYGAASVAIPGTPLTANGSLGFERGGLVADETGQKSTKADWLFGIHATFDPVTIAIAYVGSNLPRSYPVQPLQGRRANSGAGDGIVLTLTASF